MKIDELREIASKRNEGYWHETPGMSTNWHEYTEEFEEAMESHIDALLDVAEAAKAIGNHTMVCEVIIMEPSGPCDCGFDNLRSTMQKLDGIK